MNSLARFACYRISFSLRYRQGYRVFPIVSSYLIGQQLRIVTGIKMQSRGQANGSDGPEEHGDSVKKSTRSEVKQKEKENRELYLQMSIGQKRKLYKCKKKFNILEDIPTWDEYYHENKADLLKKLGNKKTKPLYEVNEVINRKVSIWKGDITTLEIDAIVNAANSSLLGGGGVDGAIHEAAGRKLLEECVTLHGCNTGEAKITGGYKLPAKYVIHTVGPIGEKELLLTNAYKNSLKVMMENKLRSLALPCISTGIYGYDNQKACHVALKVVRKFLTENADSVDRIIFCLFLPKDVDLYEENMQIYFPVETTETNKEGTSSEVEMKETESETISKIKTKGSSLGKENVKASESENKEDISSDVEMKETESTIKSKLKTKGGSVGKENVKASETEDKEEISSDVEMKETESTIESKLKTKGGSVGKENVKASESESKEKTSSDVDNEKSAETTKSKTKGKDSSLTKESTESLKAAKSCGSSEEKANTDPNEEKSLGVKQKETGRSGKKAKTLGKEKTSSDVDNGKSTETTKSKTKGKDSSLTKENTESLKAKDKKGTSSDVEMKETESTIKSKLKTKGGSTGKEKVKASESGSHDMETESNNRSSDDAQELLGRTNVSKNENGDKETDDKQFGKCDPVQMSRM